MPKTEIPFPIVFIAGRVSASIRKCVRRAGLQSNVKVLDAPHANLKSGLLQNWLYDRICSIPNCTTCPAGNEDESIISRVVYIITCNRCGCEYTGETARFSTLEKKNRSRRSTDLSCRSVNVLNSVDFGIASKF